jgi:catechol 2,3-dioxygenase-like lactoylglutathione lyase family enzyme
MQHPNFFILYVNDPLASAAFYEKLLGRAPVQAQSTFALFVLEGGIKLGLWSRHTVEPAAKATGGGHELCFHVIAKARVDEIHAEWCALGLPIAQPPTEMDFGRTFVALDPDQHRLRVFAST